MPKYKVRVRSAAFNAPWTTSFHSTTLEEIIAKHPLINMHYNRSSIEGLTIRGAVAKIRAPLNRDWMEVTKL